MRRALLSTAAAPRPKLVYLPFRAMAETTRMLLAHGGIQYDDEAVWGAEFQWRRQSGRFPWGKVPALELEGPAGRVVAQSGAMARWAARLADAYPADPARGALVDSVYELGQELCTINPLVNCYVGAEFDAVKAHYFRDVMPGALPMLERELERALAEQERSPGEDEGGGFFVSGPEPTLADFNIFHHLDNAMLVRFSTLGSAEENL